MINDQSIWGAFDLEDHALVLEQMRATGVEEGSFVYALGFPMNLVDSIKVPICRLGCIARVTDAFCSKKERQYIWWMPKHFRVVQAALL